MCGRNDGITFFNTFIAMIRLFKMLHPAALFIFPVLAIVLWVIAGKGYSSSDPVSGFVYLEGVLSSLSGWMGWFLSLLLVVLQAFLVSRLVNHHEVLYKKSHLPSLFYILFTAAIPGAFQLHPLLVSNLLLLLALDKILDLFKNENPAALLFDSSFLISIASMFWLPSAWLLFFHLYCVINLRPFHWRDWAIVLIGFALPYFFVGVYYFLTDRLPQFGSALSHWFEMNLNFSFTSQPPVTMALYLLAGLLILWSLISIRVSFYKNSVKTRIGQNIIVVFLFITFLQLFFSRHAYPHQLLQLALPCSILVSTVFLRSRKKMWLYELIFWVFLALIVVQHITQRSA